MKKIKKKVVVTIVRGMRPMSVMNTIKELKLGGNPSVHYARPKIKRLYTVGRIRISKNDTVVSCETREPLRRLRSIIRRGCKDLRMKPKTMETFSAIITEDKEFFYA